jgi:hypothetical protein
MSTGETMAYRSPISKLLRFFRWSRDQWKEKCKVAKRENKSLKTRLAKMKESRDRWKTEARRLREAHSARSPTPEEPPKNDMPRPATRCR